MSLSPEEQQLRDRFFKVLLEATLPLGDAESLERLRERTEDTVSRPAGSTTLVDADIPPAESG